MTNEIQEKDDDSVDPKTAAFLRADAIVAAINANLSDGMDGLPPIPKDYVFKKIDRPVVGLAHHAVFELIGGLPAFVHWAATNKEKFYALWNKFGFQDIDAPTGNTFVFQTTVPDTPLDKVTIDLRGNVVIDDQEVPE